MKPFLLAILFCIVSLAYAQTPELWGTASLGGTNGIGTIMKINGDGTGFQRVFSFTSGSQQSTLLPVGSLLYGNTVSGGVGSAIGSIFSYNSGTGAFDILFSFDTSSGYYPRTSLIMATDGNFYGNTNNGGAHLDGTLFRFNPSNNSFQKLLDFKDTVSGKYPVGDVFMASNGKLYGMTSSGNSIGGGGLIYSYALTGGTFTVEHEFNFTDGFTPLGGSFVEKDGLLYGMAFGGGTMGYGVIFSFNLASGVQSVVHNFNGTEGAAPKSTLLKATNGLLYGMTSQGGMDNDGVIFSFNTANNDYTVLHDFADSTGNKPSGSLIQASDGNLYGMTQFGGANNFGVIFSFTIGTGAYAKLHDCNFTDGALPYGDLIEYSGATAAVDVVPETDFAAVYPNPCAGNITVTLDDVARGAQLQLRAISGALLEKRALTETSTRLALDYPAGVYFLLLTNEKRSMMERIVVVEQE